MLDLLITSLNALLVAPPCEIVVLCLRCCETATADYLCRDVPDIHFQLAGYVAAFYYRDPAKMLNGTGY